MPTSIQTKNIYLPRQQFFTGQGKKYAPSSTAVRDIKCDLNDVNVLSSDRNSGLNVKKAKLTKLRVGLLSILLGCLASVLVAAIVLPVLFLVVLTTTVTTTTSTTSTSTTSTTSTSTTSTTSTSTTSTTTTTTTTTTSTTTTTAPPITSAFWSLNSNALELYNTGLDGTLINSPSYTTSLFGYGAAVNLAQSSTQYISITSRVVPLNSRSFTIEAWIYPIGFTGGDYGIFGQCQSASTNLCLHFVSRSNRLYCAFFNNDLQGATTLTMNAWSHVACVYDATTSTQQVWLNGVLDGSRSAAAYQGTSGTTTIGATFNSGGPATFNGYIDHVRFETRAKNSTEILNDGTLYVYYSFDGGSIIDGGPNGINTTASGSPTTATGRRNQALQFGSGSYLYYTFAPFYFLGISNQPFSISFWVKRTGAVAASTLVFLETSNWCVHIIATTSSGQLTADLWNGGRVTTNGPILSLNTWTHIGYTYSSANGLRLYINGSLYSSTGSFGFSASGVAMYIILGSDGGRTSCSPGYGGSFAGAIDEFYLYRVEITAAQVTALSNP